MTVAGVPVACRPKNDWGGSFLSDLSEWTGVGCHPLSAAAHVVGTSLMAWRVARALDVLLAEINAMAPQRAKAADGSIGDAAHSSRASDHNPNVAGVVCARDFTHDPAHGCDAPAIAEYVRRLGKSGDRRVKYVISNARIASWIGDWAWRPYTGINAHRHHVHVSVSTEPRHYDSTAPWGIDQEDEVKDADIKAIAAEVVKLMNAARTVPNQKLHPGDKPAANFTQPGVLSNIELNQDQEAERDLAEIKLDTVTRRLVSEIHAAVVKPGAKAT